MVSLIAKPRFRARTIDWIVPLFAIACVFLTGCRNPAALHSLVAEEALIREQDAAWSDAANSHDLKTTLSFYTEDAVLLPPDADAAADPTAIRDSWSGLLKSVQSLTWKPSKIEIAESADLAYLYGTWVTTAKDGKGGIETDHGKMLEVWKKQPDGSWKCVADIYNGDAPAAAALATR